MTTFNTVAEWLHGELWKGAGSPVDPILCHYTDAAGFHGIVQSNSLWMTNIGFLNDATEYKYARQLFSSELADTAHQHLTPRGKIFLDAIVAADVDFQRSDNMEMPLAFVTCFSRERDSLSQWRAYGRGEGGYCLLFDAARLFAATESTKDTALLRCEYNEARLKKLCGEVVSRSIAEIDQYPTLDIATAVQALSDALSWAPACVKHHAFSAENEWRLVRFTSPGETRGLEFRPTRTLTPYETFRFSPRELAACLMGVVVGPQRHMTLATRAAALFLEKHVETSVPVTQSVVPFRDVTS